MRAAGMLLLVAVACGARPELDDPLAGLNLAGDAPFDLAEDQDLELLRADFAALPDDAPGRVPLRRQLAEEYARRMRAALTHGDHAGAHTALRALLALWSAADLRRPEAVSRELAAHRPALLRAREVFARAGRDHETAAALAALLLAEPGRAGVHRAELDEIFAYADELALASEERVPSTPRPIEILQRLVEVHPAPWVADRLVALYVANQAAADSRMRRDGGVAGLRPLDPATRTAWHVTRVMARAGRIDEAPVAIQPLDGFGDDRELRDRLRRALSEKAAPADWVLLGARFHASDPKDADFGAALAIGREGVRRFPRSAGALLAAADAARQLGEPALAIHYYERGLAIEPAHAEATAALGGLYVQRMSALTLSDRPAAAARMLESFERFHAAATRALGKPVEPDLADAQAALGRGLISLGQLERARQHLQRSLDRRPTIDALESLGTIALKQDRFDAAIALYERALVREEKRAFPRFQQCRLMRLLAESYRGAGRAQQAASRYRSSLRAWHELMEDMELSAAFAAEALVEQGKVLWQLGERETALAAFDAAVDVDPNGASIHADVVSFLIVRDEYERALDAYHRALGSREIGDYFKVYMSLWVLAEARRQGVAIDPLATDFLADRDGPLWYDDLARYAAGRIQIDALRRRATTRARRAELLYYTAVLPADVRKHAARARELLEGVVRTDMVLFFEYDMAKHWLRNGFEPVRRE
jgi:tetratricopeptide (TPR) repeat protein